MFGDGQADTHPGEATDHYGCTCYHTVLTESDLSEDAGKKEGGDDRHESRAGCCDTSPKSTARQTASRRGGKKRIKSFFYIGKESVRHETPFNNLRDYKAEPFQSKKMGEVKGEE